MILLSHPLLDSRCVTLLSFVILLSLSLGGPTEAAAQNASDASPSAVDASLSTGSFSTEGLYNEEVIRNIYLGKFVNVPFDRDDMRFGSMYTVYLNSYAEECDAHLPPDKVEITKEQCSMEQVTTNGWGVETSRYCVDWVTVRTGLYADPEMYKAKQELDRLHTRDGMRNALKLIEGNSLSEIANLGFDIAEIESDMHGVVRMNHCDGDGLNRFQENLRLFALAKRPNRLPGEAANSSVVTPSDAPYEDQNYTKLLEDLIGDQARNWLVNQFLGGSVEASVSARDDQGRPSKIVAQYTFVGFNNDRSRGSVTLAFDEGWPECMYFFDDRHTCRTPDRRIVAAYADGSYAE